MPQLRGNEWLFLGYCKKIEDCAATAVLNKLDVREGSQGDIHPSVYSFRYPSPRCFSCPLLSVPSRTSWQEYLFGPCKASLSYFDAGAGAAVLGAGATVLGAGADFTAAVLGAGVAGAVEL